MDRGDPGNFTGGDAMRDGDNGGTARDDCVEDGCVSGGGGSLAVALRALGWAIGVPLLSVEAMAVAIDDACVCMELL